MFKKIAVIIAMLVLFASVSAFADEAQYGLHLTIRTNNGNLIYQYVEFTYNNQTEYDTTDELGEVTFGSNYDSGIYYLETTWDNHTYYKTLTKPANSQIGYIWTLNQIEED